MADSDARIPSIPPGWDTPRSSRAPLQLLAAELFNRSFTRAPDDWLHVAPLKRPPMWLTAATGVIAACCLWVTITVFAQAGALAEKNGAMPYIVGGFFGLVALFFIATFLNAIWARRTRGSWGNRQCIAVGRSGIAIRVQAVSVNVPWDEITAVRATLTNTDNGVAHRGRAQIPVLRVERGLEKWDLASWILDASPTATYFALHYYWTHPLARGELGTTVGQQRIDAVAAGIPSNAPAAPPAPGAA